jgi:pyrroline-5-carboxylate reductase
LQAHNLSVAFIGAGNMAKAMIHGLLGTGLPAAELRAADPLPAARDSAASLGIGCFADNADAIRGANVVVLAVKPQLAAEVVAALEVEADQLVVSIMAGINLDSLSTWLPPAQPIVRCMPNTPALLGEGMTALYANAHVTAEQRNFAERVLQAAGKTVWVETEEALDAVTAVSGSGPAYFFLLMEAMIEAGKSMQLDEDLARQLTLQTALGAAMMALEGDQTPAELRRNVTSPGGTTERALEVMQEGHIPQVVEKALVAAEARAKELAAQFGASS